MMKNRIFLIFVFSGFILFGQNDTLIKTFKVSKSKIEIFKGVEEEIIDWYLFIDEDGICYMANIFVEINEVEIWFKNRKNSENILKSSAFFDPELNLYLSRKNEPDEILSFKINYTKESIKMQSMRDESIYNFKKINIQPN